MSTSPNQNQLFINDGTGRQLPVQTGTFLTPAINMLEKRRLSITIGISSSTGAANSTGAGFTGTLLVQGTDELPNAGISTGTPWAGVPVQPGQNAYSGAYYWQTIPSGTVLITNNTINLQLGYTDIMPAYIRLAFNAGTFSGISATGTLGGSGTWNIFYTAKGR